MRSYNGWKLVSIFSLYDELLLCHSHIVFSQTLLRSSVGFSRAVYTTSLNPKFTKVFFHAQLFFNSGLSFLINDSNRFALVPSPDDTIIKPIYSVLISVGLPGPQGAITKEFTQCKYCEGIMDTVPHRYSCTPPQDNEWFRTRSPSYGSRDLQWVAFHCFLKKYDPPFSS